jgi:hypothetical protein
MNIGLIVGKPQAIIGWAIRSQALRSLCDGWEGSETIRPTPKSKDMAMR